MKYITAIFSYMAIFCIYAQNGSFNLGGRSAGMAGASLTLQDEYSLFNNIGGIGSVESHSVFAGYQNRYGISAFQIIGSGILYHTKIGNAGVGFYKFGDDLFSQQRIHIAVGNKIQMVSLALGLDLLQYHVSTIGSRQTLAIQFGGIAEITPQISFGAHIYNLNQAKLSTEIGEKIPTVMKAGFSYRPSKKLMLNIEVEKDLDFDEIIKAGLEYQVIKQIYVRTGVSTNPSMSAFGIGFHPGKLKFDYAFSNDSNLGGIHEVSLAYSFSK